MQVQGRPVLVAKDLTKRYLTGRGGTVDALRGVSLTLYGGSTLGVVGESGCGKSTLARLLVGLEAPSSGSLEMLGEPLRAISRLELARRAQLVFQDPFSSLNPRLTVGATISEVLRAHGFSGGRSARRDRVGELLSLVALAPHLAERYPHELSGGQAQRVAIARALAVGPRILVLDEPTSALDVSVRAEVLNLLLRLQDELSLSYVFISHDLSMVRHISDVIVVMYLGKVVEQGPWDAVLGAPLHPYTHALAEAVPVPDPELEEDRRGRGKPVGVLPELAAEEPASGCSYQPRCPRAETVCRLLAPELVEVSKNHLASCHLAARHTSNSLVPKPARSAGAN